VQKGEDYTVEAIPENLVEAATEYREKLLEAVAEADDELMELYLGGQELSTGQIKAAIRKLTVHSQVYPVLCGSAFKNKGVQPMLDAVIDYLPSPLDVPPVVGLLPTGRRQSGNPPFPNRSPRWLSRLLCILSSGN
jgi:elongation factor G